MTQHEAIQMAIDALEAMKEVTNRHPFFDMRHELRKRAATDAVIALRALPKEEK